MRGIRRQICPIALKALAAVLTFLPACALAQVLDVEYTREAPDDAAVSGSLDLFSGSSSVPRGLLDPLGMSGYSIGGKLQGQVQLGDHMLIGGLDYRFDRAQLDGETYQLSHDVTVGPRVSFTEGTTTEVFYRYSRAQLAEGLAAPAAEADSYGAGLAQTWHFAGRRGHVRLEYGVHEGRDLDAQGRAEGQALNLSGVIPLRWGIHATFEADYRTNAYLDYPGAPDLESATTALSAGLRTRIGERMHGGVSLSYADEDFDSDLLPMRRSAWGIKLRLEP
jgi:hypothetical protein